ncbi:squalene synthase 1-like [Rutidosis leptorrhynchoides]|uniref:squalene synthase 1-like n=1 Tax=Rutidosis leptorrhynchoides TaxID=125765 RepID=UPI003A9A1FB2
MKRGSSVTKHSSYIETINDDEYCYAVSSIFVEAFAKLFHISGEEMLFPDTLTTPFGLFLQQGDVIRDFWLDINETPKSLIFWPDEIWSKYANNLKDLTYEENSENAIRCLNEMVTNALAYVGDCVEFLSRFRNPSTFRFFAILQVVTFGDLALCYNNIQVFRTGIKTSEGLMAKVFVQTKTMEDVYGALYDFSSILRSKVDMNDPNAETTISRIEAVQKLCRDSGTLIKWKSYIIQSQSSHNQALVTLFFFDIVHFHNPLRTGIPQSTTEHNWFNILRNKIIDSYIEHY